MIARTIDMIILGLGMRDFIYGVVVSCLSMTLVLPSASSYAAEFPNRAVHLVVGYEAGGGADTIARLLARKLTARWGQPVVVEDRPGADGTIAAGSVARAVPDGYTIMMITFAHTISATERVLTYDPNSDFAPIIQAATQPDLLLVNPSVPATSVKELIELARGKPGQLNFASTGVGGPPFLDMALFMAETKTKFVDVTYRGTGPSLLAAMEGEVQVVFGGIATGFPMAASGKLRALAVTSSIRSPLMPDLPTISEAAGLNGFDGGTWEGIVAPAKTPADIIKKIHDDTADALKADDVTNALSRLGFIVVAGTSQEFATRIASDIVKWRRLLTDMGIKPH
jgi:tripartite-type tricarboxylate transporter receptor subunit TctC